MTEPVTVEVLVDQVIAAVLIEVAGGHVERELHIGARPQACLLDRRNWTRLLAAVVGALCERTCRIALCAFTHRAVGNALLAIRRVAPRIPVFKLASSGGDDRDELEAAGVQLVDARRVKLPERGCVVAGTCFQLAKLQDKEQFHYTVFDEAGQLPIPQTPRRKGQQSPLELINEPLPRTRIPLADASDQYLLRS